MCRVYMCTCNSDRYTLQKIWLRHSNPTPSSSLPHDAGGICLHLIPVELLLRAFDTVIQMLSFRIDAYE